jgi:glycosyltransferase involved in cell wall biosynthesis
MIVSSEPRFSIIVPVHNGGKRFRRCLLSLAALESPPAEIIVVADGETDGAWRMAEAIGAQALKVPVTGGPARARNLGARAAKGDILFFVDADVTVPRDAVGQIAAAFQSNPELTAVFGSYDDEPFETNFLSQYKNLLHHYVHQTANREASTFWAACGAIRREVFLAMSGFDEGYRRPSIEDIELGYRLKRAGYNIGLLKALQVKHLKRWNVRSLLKADFFCRALPWTALILSAGPFIDDLNLKISNRISVILIFLLLLALLGAWFVPSVMVFAMVVAVALLAFNWPLYRFFYDKRGFGFAIKTIPWHWFYFLYSGLAFMIGFVKHRLKKHLP